jgi:hypothetical protein
MTIKVDQVKHDSEQKVLAAGGQICDWLPHIEFTKLRTNEEVLNRALILNAMLNIAFKAPIDIIKDWIEKHELSPFLSASEKAVLNKQASDLTAQELANLHWYIEALWSCLWATQIIEKMSFTEPISDSMASLCPNLQRNEGPAKFAERMKLRSYEEIYKERDLYYRVMWCCRHFKLSGKEHPNFNMDLVMERRRSLEWIMDSDVDWDNYPQDT